MLSHEAEYMLLCLTIPTFLTKWQNDVYAKKQQIILQKLSNATDQMVGAEGSISGYKNTEDFVNHLKKYYKLQKACPNNNLRSCWPYDKVITDKGEWDISNTKVAKNLKIPEHLGTETGQTTKMNGFSLGKGVTYLEDAIVGQSHDIPWPSLIDGALALSHELGGTAEAKGLSLTDVQVGGIAYEAT